MTLQIDALGERMNLVVTQGATFGPILATMLNPDLSEVNLTGCVIFGSVRKTPGAATEEAAIAVTITAPLTGNYEFEIAEAETDGLSAGDFLESAESAHVWELYLKDTAGRVLPLYYGTLRARKRFTRPTP
jgi:hypothetical protein